MLTIEFYEKKSKITRKVRWYWRAIAANGRIVGDSGQGYTEERWAREGFNVLKNGVMDDRGYNVRVVYADGTAA